MEWGKKKNTKPKVPQLNLKKGNKKNKVFQARMI